MQSTGCRKAYVSVNVKEYIETIRKVQAVVEKAQSVEKCPAGPRCLPDSRRLL